MIPLDAKVPADVRRYLWTPALADGDAIATQSASATGCTIDSADLAEDGVELFVSGGTAGATATITVTITTDLGETITQTFYLPIVESASQIAATARDYCNFALRKIVGNGNDPDASELNDALERLNALVASWRAGGADIGAPFPIEANSVIYCPDWAVSALRYNLLMDCAPLYGVEPTMTDAMNARRGLQLVKHNSLPTEREGADYY